MFWLTVKKMASRLLFPVPLLLLALGVGLWMIWSPKRSEKARRCGKWLLLSALALTWLAGVTGSWWLGLLSEYYPACDVAGLQPGVFYTIAVAGGGFDLRGELPPVHRFGARMRLRLLEAARLAQACEARGNDYRLVVSVAEPDAPAREKLEALTAWFAQFGIGGDRILLVESAYNTPAEVARFAAVAEGRTLLVTEGFHMPRTFLLARRAGLDAVPAPAGVEDSLSGWTPLALIPSAGNLERFARFANEMLGMLEAVLLH